MQSKKDTIEPLYMGQRMLMNPLQTEVLVLRYHLLNPLEVSLTGLCFVSVAQWNSYCNKWKSLLAFKTITGVILNLEHKAAKVRLDIEQQGEPSRVFFVDEDTQDLDKLELIELI